MDFTTDKLRSMVRKWQTLIEAHVDVKTTDGYLLRMFCIAFTKKRQQQVKKTCYAQSSQIRQIRKKMVELMTREAAACDLKELVGKFIPEAIGAPLALLPQTLQNDWCQHGGGCRMLDHVVKFSAFQHHEVCCGARQNIKSGYAYQRVQSIPC